LSACLAFPYVRYSLSYHNVLYHSNLIFVVTEQDGRMKPDKFLLTSAMYVVLLRCSIFCIWFATGL